MLATQIVLVLASIALYSAMSFENADQVCLFVRKDGAPTRFARIPTTEKPGIYPVACGKARHRASPVSWLRLCEEARESVTCDTSAFQEPWGLSRGLLVLRAAFSKRGFSDALLGRLGPRDGVLGPSGDFGVCFRGLSGSPRGFL